MPPLSRAHYRRELVVWSVLPIMLGAVEGGVVGVLAKNAFAGAAPEAMLNIAVGVLAGAKSFANIISFLWAGASHGRDKIRFITGMQVAMVVMIAAMAFVPLSATGLLMLLVLTIGSRFCWSGVQVLRSTVWGRNYPRHARATLAGKLSTVHSLVMAGAGYLIGRAMEVDHEAFRVMYPLAAGAGMVGALLYRRMRLRGHRALLLAEQAEGHSQRALFNPLRMRRTLLENRSFRAYMTCMFVFGMGNLMVLAPLIIVMKDRFELDESTQVLIASTVPLLIIPISVHWWSKLLDRVHIITFRAAHSWSFVMAILMFLLASLSMQTWLLYVAAVCLGVAQGGGVLGWNLGHHDFTTPEHSARYMGVHVTLTGIRGVFAPLIGVCLYQILEWLFPQAGGGRWVFAFCLALSATGAVGFVVLSRRLVKPAAG